LNTDYVEEKNRERDEFLTFYEKERLKDQRQPQTGEFNIGEGVT